MSQTVPKTRSAHWPAIVVLCIGQLMIVLDGSIVNVALPSIQRNLDFSQGNLAWVVNSYMIAFGGLLLLAGRLGDLLGRRRIFFVGQAVFIVASLLCGLSGNETMLLVSRFLQGAGGAMVSSVVLGMIVTMCDGPTERAKAIGVYSFASSAGGSIGLLAGGVLTQAFSWHWIFFVNLPIGLLVVAFAWRLVAPDTAAKQKQGADVAGATLVTAAVMLTVYTIVKTSDYGWGSSKTLILGAVSAVLFAAFFARQAKASSPLLPLRILRSRNVSWANIIQVLMLGGMFGFQFLGALYMQRVLGFNPVETGLGIWPVALFIGGFALFISSRMIARLGARTVLLIGLVLIGIGLAVLSQVPSHGSYAADVLPALPLIGAGFGLGMPALTTLAMSGATPQDSGIVSGLFNMMQQVGGALGLAVLSTLAASRTTGLLAGGKTTVVALTGGYDRAFTTAAGFVVVGLVLAAVTLRSPAAAKAKEESAEAAQAPVPAHSS